MNRRDAIALSSRPRRCVYCARPCYGRASNRHGYLTKIEAAMFAADPYRELRPLRDELREAVSPAKGTEA